MKITGGRNYIRFDFENGYVARAGGELLAGRVFVVDKNTLKFWDPPHEQEAILSVHIEEIIREVNRSTNEHTARIIFD